MRILRVTAVPRTKEAGVSGVLLHSGDALTRMGHDVEYLFGENLLRSPVPPWLSVVVLPVMTCFRILQHARRSHFDVVEIHRPFAWIYALLSGSRLFRRRLAPCVLQCQGLEELLWETMRVGRAQAGLPMSWRSRGLYRLMVFQARLASRFATGMAVPTETDVGYVVERLGIPISQVTRVPNGTEPSFFTVPRSAAPACLRVLFFGSWLDRKGAPDLVRAWATVQQCCPSTSLTVAGCGCKPDEVRDSFHPQSRDAIEVIPNVPRSEVLDLFARHDVLVLPSWYEGMPLAVLEAAASGMAVVTTRIAGTTDIFRAADPERDGAILIDVHSHGDLAKAVCRLAEDRALLGELQAGARRRAALFTWESSARSFVAAYEKALSAPSARRPQSNQHARVFPSRRDVPGNPRRPLCTPAQRRSRRR